MEESLPLGPDNAQLSRLLIIPRELRDNIYEHLVVAPEQFVELPQHEARATTRSETSVMTHFVREGHGEAVALYRTLSLTCRQLRLEVKASFLRHNAFGAWIRNPRCLRPSITDGLEDLRRLLLFRYDHCSGKPCILDLTFDKSKVHGEVIAGQGGSWDLANLISAVSQGRNKALTTQRHFPGGAEERIMVAFEEFKERLKRDGKLTLEIPDTLTAALVKVW